MVCIHNFQLLFGVKEKPNNFRYGHIQKNGKKEGREIKEKEVAYKERNRIFTFSQVRRCLLFSLASSNLLLKADDSDKWNKIQSIFRKNILKNKSSPKFKVAATWTASETGSLRRIQANGFSPATKNHRCFSVSINRNSNRSINDFMSQEFTQMYQITCK